MNRGKSRIVLSLRRGKLPVGDSSQIGYRFRLTSDISSGCETSTNNGRFGLSDRAVFRDKLILGSVVYDRDVSFDAGGVKWVSPRWRIQIYRALNTIDHIGHSKFAAKQEQNWLPSHAVKGLYSFGYKNLVFDQAITFTNWLREEYPDVRLFSEVDREMVAEYLGEKVATCTPDTIRTMLATLKKLQEGLRTMNWIHEEIVPQEWLSTAQPCAHTLQ
jgi:hypothetical protein